jgi:hypothetical protein
MDLSPYVDSIRRDLTAAAEVAGPDARTAAERLTAALDAAMRLALMDALSTAAEEVTRELAPGSVDVRLRGREPEFVVTPPPSVHEVVEEFEEVPPPPPPPDPEQGTSRVTLRLPESLKSQVEEAAAREGVSVNTWLVRAVSAALAGPSVPPRPPRPPRAPSGSGPRIGKRLTGWAR